MTVPFPSTALGCPARGAYDMNRAQTYTTQFPIKGRPRGRLRDEHPSWLGQISLVLREDQMPTWHQFWDAINRGRDWFEMDLWIAGRLKTCNVHATAPFAATLSAPGQWTVNLGVEAVPQ